MKPISLFTVFLLLLTLSLSASVTNWPTGQQYLMVDQHGSIVPAGYTAGLDEIAAQEAQTAATAQAVVLQAQTTAAASNVVDEVVSALTGAYGFAYVTGYTVSFDGAVAVSTNASAHMVFLNLGAAGTTNISGTAYTGHYVWHVYSEAMNSMPAVKYKRELNGTNAWEYVQYQSTAEFVGTQLNPVVVNGVDYLLIYRSTIWIPSVYSTAFFMAFCEIKGSGLAAGLLEIIGGFTVNGASGFTGDFVDNGWRQTYDGGLLMSVTNEVAQ